MPFDVGAHLESADHSHVAVAHTGLIASRECERGILQAVRRFRESPASGLPSPPPRMSAWCEARKLRTAFFGNFVIYKTAFMTSVPVLRLSHHLYEEHGEGYFGTRWGDQASPPAYVCHGLAPSDGDGYNASAQMQDDPRLLDLSTLRGSVFVHGKDGRKRPSHLYSPYPTWFAGRHDAKHNGKQHRRQGAKVPSEASSKAPPAVRRLSHMPSPFSSSTATPSLHGLPLAPIPRY